MFRPDEQINLIFHRQGRSVKAYSLIGLIFSLVLFLSITVTQASVSKTLNYQGQLKDQYGVPVNNDDYNMTIRLYDAPTGGNCLWSARGSCGTPGSRSVSTVNGIFSIVLGDTGASDNALNLDFSSQYYLSIQIAPDASEMSPRKPLTAVPQALNANSLMGDGRIDLASTAAANPALNVTYNPSSGANSAAIFTYGSGGGTGTALNVTQAGSGLALRINDDGTLTDATPFAIDVGGNVGVGTASPGYKFDVVGAVNASGGYYNSSGPAYINEGYGWRYHGDAQHPFQVLDGASLNIGYTAAGGAYPSSGLVVAGNVGIGTTSPNAGLHVHDRAITNTGIYGIAMTTSTSWAGFALDSGSSTKTVGVHFGDGNDLRLGRYGDGLGGWEANPYRFDLDAPVDTLVVTDAGNVGIGTAGPSGKFDVSGSFYTENGRILIRAEDGSNEGGQINLAGAAAYNTSFIDNWQGNSRLFWIDGNNHELHIENYGAGTANLSVEGAITAAGGTMTGVLNITGGAGGLKLGANNWVDGGSTYGHVISDNSTYKALMIVGNNIAGNSGLGREVKLWDYLNVQGSFSTTGRFYGVGTTDVVTNLNADLLDGNQGSYYMPASTDNWVNITGDTMSGRLGLASSGIHAASKDDITTRTDSGFFQTSSATIAEGWPENSNGWYHLFGSTHTNDGNYYSMQFAGSFFDSASLYYRATNGSGTTAWNKIWHAGNDGSTSTLDADVLDGLHKTSFGATLGTSGSNLTLLNSDGGLLNQLTAPYASSSGNADTLDGYHYNGLPYLGNTAGSGLAVSYAGSGGPNVLSSDNGAAMLSLHRPGLYAVNFGLDTDNTLKVGGWSMGSVSYKMWHEGNDGSGSGLDADTLDGFNSSAFGDATAANQTTILSRIGTASDAAAMDSTLFAGQQAIYDAVSSISGGGPSGWTCTVRTCYASGTGSASCTASCTGNEKAISGGCGTGNTITGDRPTGQGWYCSETSGMQGGDVYGYANCCQ